jgi:hypothetical protein
MLRCSVRFAVICGHQAISYSLFALLGHGFQRFCWRSPQRAHSDIRPFLNSWVPIKYRYFD